MQRVQRQRGRIYAETKNKVRLRAFALDSIDFILRPIYGFYLCCYLRIRTTADRERADSFLSASDDRPFSGRRIFRSLARSHHAISRSILREEKLRGTLGSPVFPASFLFCSAELSYGVVFTFRTVCVWFTIFLVAST